MVGKNLYWKRGPLEVVLSHLQASYDCEEFSVINVIVSFSRREGLGEI